MAVILDGRLVASVVMEELKEQVKTVRTRGVTPTLALVFVGEDRYSRQYVEMKARRCREVGVEAPLMIFRHRQLRRMLSV